MLNATSGRWLTDVLRAHEEQIVAAWVEKVSATLRGRQTTAELDRQVRELLATLSKLGAEVDEVDLSAPTAAELRGVLADLSRARARSGFSSTETAVSVFALKDAVLAVIDLNDGDAVRDYLGFSRLTDQMGLFTFETYAAAREELITDQAHQLLELSTPVVKLWEGVLAVPLVGTLDSARAQVVMEKLLQALVDTGSAYAIIDITGVPAVDTQVAQHVLKTVVAARLMGAECVISGIRPQIAQTIVALGIEFGDISTKASLADALVLAMRATGSDVVRRTAKDR